MTHDLRAAKRLTMPQTLVVALAYQLHAAMAAVSAGDVR